MYTDSSVAFGMPFRELTDEELDCLITSGELSSTLIEDGTTNDLVRPEPPWRFESDRWLPGTEMLHRLVSLYSEGAQGPSFETDAIFFPLYERLQIEYIKRITNTECRLRGDHVAKYTADFR
jgi:hypothetical protein